MQELSTCEQLTSVIKQKPLYCLHDALLPHSKTTTHRFTQDWIVASVLSLRSARTSQEIGMVTFQSFQALKILVFSFSALSFPQLHNLCSSSLEKFQSN